MPSTKLYNYTIEFLNQEEYHQLKDEIFIDQQYYFETEEPAPRIIDAGAHIGLATLYFKRLYPGAQIVALEPHPENYRLLEENVWSNNLSDVKTAQVALSDHQGKVELFSDTEFEWFSSAGIHQGAWTGEMQTESFLVDALPLSHFIDGPIDLLKLDIEGAEQMVLLAAKEKLHLVKHMLIEFHSHQSQKLATLQKFLENLGYEIAFIKHGKKVHFQLAKGMFLIEAKKKV